MTAESTEPLSTETTDRKLCGRWMPRAKTTCGRRAGHQGQHKTAEMIAKCSTAHRNKLRATRIAALPQAVRKMVEEGVLLNAAVKRYRVMQAYPVGYQFPGALLTTIELVEYRPRPDKPSTCIPWVRCQCSCGSAPKWYRLSNLQRDGTKSCGCQHYLRGSAHRNYKGVDNPRMPSEFVEIHRIVELQGGLCAFCKRPLDEAKERGKPAGNGHIHGDHAHDRGCEHPDDLTCQQCFRGAVCHDCNTVHIRHFDHSRRYGPVAGEVLPEEVLFFQDSYLDVATGERIPWQTPLQRAA